MLGVAVPDVVHRRRRFRKAECFRSSHRVPVLSKVSASRPLHGRLHKAGMLSVVNIVSQCSQKSALVGHESLSLEMH